MFYLETKDGERFLTNIDSDDKAEFSNIIENKLGVTAAEMFNDFITESVEDVHDLLLHLRNRYDNCVQALDSALNDETVDRIKLEEVLCDLQSIYLDLRELTG